MLRRLWISPAVGLLLLGCSTTTELKTRITHPPVELLTAKPLIVQPTDPESESAADLVRQLLQENGYVIRQDTEVTGALLEAFGTPQVQPTGDSALLRVRARLSAPKHSSRLDSRQVSLTSCNYLREQDPCDSRRATLRVATHTVTRQGSVEMTLEEAGRPPRTLTTDYTAATHGVVPALPVGEVLQQMRQALQRLLGDSLKRQEEVATGMEVDRLAADMIALGLYEAATVRLQDHESDLATRLYALGYIEEQRRDLSGAVRYYREGVLSGEHVELFDAAIARIERLRTFR